MTDIGAALDEASRALARRAVESAIAMVNAAFEAATKKPTASVAAPKRKGRPPGTTTVDYAEIDAMLRTQTMSDTAIAAKLGVHQTNVSKRRRFLGLPALLKFGGRQPRRAAVQS